MARSSGDAGRASVQEKLDNASFLDQPSGYLYAVDRVGTNYFLRLSQNDEAGSSRRLAYFVGSGHKARSYLLSEAGFLYEAPVTYYSDSGKWGLSPGYQKYSSPFLTRAVAPGCLKCHASQVQALAGTQNGYRTPPFLEGGVSCERCHGPGGAHITKMRAGDLSNGTAIVNPARLERKERADVCAQCHLSGEIRVPRPGKEQADFLPGDNLSDTVVAFVRSGGSRQIGVTSHAENLAQSTCQRRSGDTLWCGTCHAPHTEPAPQAKAAWYRAKCMTCHSPSDCVGNAASRKASGDDCTACHMPKNNVTDADHVVYTDHSIPRRLDGTPAAAQRDAILAPFSGQPAQVRDLGLAYAIVALREQNAVYRERALPLLQEAERRDPDDPQTLSYLADLYRSGSQDALAVRLYERLARIDPTQISAQAALGAYEMESSHYENAIRLWKDALARNPALLLVRLNLARALLKTGHPAEARTILEKTIEFSPGMEAAKTLLRQIPKAQ